MTFAFLVHALTRRDYLRGSFADSGLPRLLRNRVFKYLAVYMLPQRAHERLRPFFGPQKLFTYPRLVSVTGAVVSGQIVGIPMLTEELITHQGRGVELICKACRHLAGEGVDLVGLGGMNGVIGSYGRAVLERSTVPVTTGASYTVFAAVDTLAAVAERLGRKLAGLRVTLAGFPGRNARALANVLVRRGVDLAVVGTGSAQHVARFLDETRAIGPVRLIEPDHFYDALERGEIGMGASSTGNQIDARRLAPGTIVIDVSLPRDVLPSAHRRRDVLVIDGEIVRVPPPSAPAADFFGCGPRHVLACFAEGCILAMEGRAESFTVGRDILPAKVEEIGALARKHGFTVEGLHSLGRRIGDEAVERVRLLAPGGRRAIVSIPVTSHPVEAHP